MRSPAVNVKEDRKEPRLFRVLRWFVLRLTPEYRLYGTDQLPEEPCVLVGNHSQMYGPLAAEFYMPRRHYTWCVGEMMNRQEVPAYAYEDFWPRKQKGLRWYYRLLSHLVAVPLPYILTNAHTIPVYHDARVMTTFRKSVGQLQSGADIVIFPESHQPYNGILWHFQEHFTDLAKLYYRKTGSAVCFVPMYVAPKLGSIHFGEPVRYCPEAPDGAERKRICEAMMTSITEIAVSLPEHTVIPYPNIPKREYPLNTDCKPPLLKENQ